MTSKLIQERFRKAFGSASIYHILESEVGPYAIYRINRRVNQGDYLGGRLASAGYSSKPIPAWHLGRLIDVDSAYQIQYTDGSFRTTVSFDRDAIQWGRGTGGARSTPWLIGGYRAFRQASGRSVSHVNLQFSGQMLNSLRHSTKTSSSGANLSVTVSPDQQDKAYKTNLHRRWMDLSDRELDDAIQILADRIESLAF